MTVARRCNRPDCNWTTEAPTRLEAQAELVQHAVDTDHWLCCICQRSLAFVDDHTCLGCVGRVKRRLAELVELFALLPDELGNLGGGRGINEGTPWEDHERRIEALVLLGPGSYGNVHRAETLTVTGTVYPHGAPGRRRLPRRWDPNAGTPNRVTGRTGAWVPVEQGDQWHSQAHGLNLDTDPESVRQTLGQWEDTWRQWRGQPVQLDPHEPLTAMVTYLMPWIGSAAQQHPAFPDFVDDIRRIHRALEDAAHRGERPERSDAPCFRCGERDLQRSFAPPDACDHWPPGMGPLRHQEWVRWRETHECDQGGRRDVWVCRTCGREYLPKDYWLALRGLFEERAKT